MEKVKKLVEAGASVGGAIKESLGMSVSAFAAKYGLPRTSTSEALNGSGVATERVIDALTAELGGAPDEWRALLRHARLAAAAGC